MLKLKEYYQRHFLIFTFLLRAIIIFLLWAFFYRSGYFNVTPLHNFLIDNLSITSEKMLNIMNYDTFRFEKHVGIENSSGVLIGPPCNAFSLFILYGGFLLAFPGQWKRKLLFLLSGILLIHLLNLARVVALILLAYHNPAVLEFNHSYTFTLIIYVCIFVLWMYWINLYSKNKATTKVESAKLSNP